jgi:RNA polymerase sigma-70 factor (ECF subfamily)
MSDNRPVPRRDNGDPEERFREIFFEYHRPVVSFFQRRGATYEESLDLAQETFLRVFQGMDSFRGEASLATWVYTIASHVRGKALRKQAAAKRRAMEERLLREIDAGEDSPADFMADDSGALDGMLTEERARVLHEALLDLPPQMRRCMQLRVEHDLKYREIAELMRVSIETVKSQLYAAKQLLKARLTDYFTDADL